jgi:hypothetical protein
MDMLYLKKSQDRLMVALYFLIFFCRQIFHHYFIRAALRVAFGQHVALGWLSPHPI